MDTCFCCEKETPLELLKSDDCVYYEEDAKNIKFCPTCQQFGFNCYLCNNYYICSRYEKSTDEYFYNDNYCSDYPLNFRLEDKEKLEKELYIGLIPAAEEHYCTNKYIVQCKVCKKKTCESCSMIFMDYYTERGDEFYCCKKCIKNKIPEIIPFSKIDGDSDISYELRKYSLDLMDTLIKEREEAKKLKKEIIKYKKSC